jgi:nitrogen fixation-related uncharacterized protein
MVPASDTMAMSILVILFIVLVGPAALLWGADSRIDDIERKRRGT